MEVQIKATAKVVKHHFSYEGKLLVEIPARNVKTEFSFSTERPFDDDVHLVIKKGDKVLLDITAPTKEKIEALELEVKIALSLFSDLITQSVGIIQQNETDGLINAEQLLKPFVASIESGSECSTGYKIPSPHDEVVYKLCA